MVHPVVEDILVETVWTDALAMFEKHSKGRDDIVFAVVDVFLFFIFIKGKFVCLRKEIKNGRYLVLCHD